MKYAIKNGVIPGRDIIVYELVKELNIQGHEQVGLSDELSFILNLASFEYPTAVVRKAQDEFVISILTLDHSEDDLKYLCYNTLVKTLSNLLVCIVQNGRPEPEIYCITPETGFYHFKYDPYRLYQSMLPVINAVMVINNRVNTNLPPEFNSTVKTRELVKFGAVLDSMGVLPSPFPLDEVLSRENLDHLYRLFRIKGISYGNLSIREKIPGLGEDTFWMTARGVDKAHLKGVGQDILLVTGYDLEMQEILVSVPPDYNSRIRVSVDAIEHALIYEAYPDVGAIVHVHAWMNGIPFTTQNYPCGTINLAREAVTRLGTTTNPGKAVIGLKNHGITITGRDLDDIFSRIEGNLITEIPMMP